MSRPSIDETLLNIAFTVSERGTCSRARTGAVIADSRGVILSTGYNGSLSGQDHCDHECECMAEFTEEPHWNNCPAHPNNGCVNAVHAEANAVYFAARNGVSVEGASIYCTTLPCVKCAEAIVQSGIKKVVYRLDYRIRDGVKLLEEVGIEVVHSAA